MQLSFQSSLLPFIVLYIVHHPVAPWVFEGLLWDAIFSERMWLNLLTISSTVRYYHMAIMAHTFNAITQGAGAGNTQISVSSRPADAITRDIF